MISKKNLLGLLILITIGLGVFLIARTFQTAAHHPVSQINKQMTKPEPTHSSETSPTTPSSVSSEPPADPKAEEQVRALEEVLKSHNDNDPRLDKDLKVLNDNAKMRFKDLYSKIPHEKRNDRGTIVFLLGRNIDSSKDLEFFKDVLNEAPCRSLDDCNKIETGGALKENDEHQGGGYAVTLVYPQLVALKSLESFLKKHPEKNLAEKTKDLIALAKHSTIPEINKMAESIESHYQNP